MKAALPALLVERPLEGTQTNRREDHEQEAQDSRLALIASLALSGVAAAAAQAETLIKSEGAGTTHLDIKNDHEVHNELARFTVGNGARFIECTRFDFTGTLAPSALTIKGTLESTECFSNGLTTAPVTITHEKCKIELTVLKLSTSTQVKTVGCANVFVHIFESVKAQEEKKSLCTYRIPAQTSTGATAVNAGGAGSAMDITVNLTGSSQINIVNEGPGGLAVCGIASGGAGKAAFSKELTITGTNSEGKAVGVTIE